jgi:hypothetical protein
VLLDVGIRGARGDSHLVYDLKAGGFAERFSAHDPALAPRQHELIESHIGVRPLEQTDHATKRLAALLTARLPAGAHAVCGRVGRSCTAATARLTRREQPGTTAQASSAATAFSSPATWSPLPDCSPRSPSPARSRPADPPCFGRPAVDGLRCRRPGIARPITPFRRGERRMTVRQLNVSTLVTLDGVLEDSGGAEGTGAGRLEPAVRR